MPKSKLKVSPQLKKHATALLVAAETVFLEGVTRAAGFEDAEDFKRSLLDALEDSARFHEAVHKVHAVPADKAQPTEKASAALKLKSRNPGPAKTGRIQASRLQPRGRER